MIIDKTDLSPGGAQTLRETIPASCRENPIIAQFCTLLSTEEHSFSFDLQHAETNQMSVEAINILEKAAIASMKRTDGYTAGTIFVFTVKAVCEIAREMARAER
jgi:hypothetical protein